MKSTTSEHADAGRLCTNVSRFAWAVVAAVVCASGWAVAAPGILGRYIAVANQRTTMTITPAAARGDAVRVLLRGGAQLRDGAHLAGDCEAVAEGRFTGNTLRARLVPFEGETMSLDATEIDRMDAEILITFEGAAVMVQGAFAHCGLRSALAGRYRKRA